MRRGTFAFVFKLNEYGDAVYEDRILACWAGLKDHFHMGVLGTSGNFRFVIGATPLAVLRRARQFQGRANAVFRSRAGAASFIDLQAAYFRGGYRPGDVVFWTVQKAQDGQWVQVPARCKRSRVK